MVVWFSSAGFLLLVFFPAPAALRKFFTASLGHDFLPQAPVSLLRDDAVGARMVVLPVREVFLQFVDVLIPIT